MSDPAGEFPPHAAEESESPDPGFQATSLPDPDIPQEPPTALPFVYEGGDGKPAGDIVAPADPLFRRYQYVAPHPVPPRKPNFGDLLVFLLIAYGALRVSGVLVLIALHHHLFGVSTFKQAENEIHYKIGSQALWYIVTLLFCIAIFPLVWSVQAWIRTQYDIGWKAGPGFFRGIHWRPSAAAESVWRLLGAAGACFAGAIADEILIPGPPNTPIDQTFHMPGAIWLLFGFGVTLAPLLEEIAYRGFLLPSLCTAYDWMGEQVMGLPPRTDASGRARWSLAAMVSAAVLTSIPFALMHGEQTAYSFGPFLLLFAISLVLCWIRLATGSLAASVLVHSSYNLLLFAMMFLGTGGFRHLDRM